jgi:serine/threonine protein kinase
MGETDTFEHFVIARRSDGSLWELGRGAMGVTYKAFDTNLRADVALKVINSHFLNSETARQRFLREARAAASLRHPNVATVFHLGNAEGGFYYAMEYVEGETVERRIQRDGPLSADLALRITRQVSRALIAADRQKLVHRDIKPSNLMLVVDDDDDHLLVKVIDFGLAKSLVAAVDQSLTISMGGFVGTPHFASPEQLEEKEIDIRSDIYSLGATLWFMLTGRPPFQGSLISVINQHLSQSLSVEVLGQLHPKIAALLERMLAKRPEDRLQSPTELKRQIDEILVALRGDPGSAATSPGSADADKTLQMPIGGTSSFGFATGELIRERYEILGRSPFDNSHFKAKDLQANRVVALRQLPLSLRNDAKQLESLRREIDRIKAAHHPNLLELFGLESYERGLFIVTEWIKGFSLQDLLRVRRVLSWEEALRVAKPLAKVLDFAAGKDLLGAHLSLRDVSVETTRRAEDPSQLQRTPITAWPPFIVKVDALSLRGSLPRASAEPAQTLIDSDRFDSGATHVQQLAGIIHELLGGVRPGSASGLHAPRLNPVANLSESGNAVLRAGATEPNRFTSASDFLAELEAAESANPPLTGPSPVPPEQHPAFALTPSAQLRSQGPEVWEDSQPKTSPILLRILLAAVGLFLLCAVGLVVGTNFFVHKPLPPPPVARAGSVTLTSNPDGATVKFDGKEIGKTPLASHSLPVGKYTLELSLPGYQSRSVDLEITQGSLNNLGLIPLIREVGQLLLKSDPPNLLVEVVDPLKKSSLGNTPMTLDNLPVGNYTVRIKRSGWPDYVQQVSVQANAVATVEHAFKGVKVSLQSDPSGATIYLGQTKLGTAPLTIELPPQPVQLVSRIGALAPVIRQVVPDPSGAMMVEFKHEYGTISFTSDRSDAEVIVGGVSLGTVPIEGILPPGQHKIVVRAHGAPDETRTANVVAGQRVVMEVSFKIASRAGTDLSARPARSPVNSGTDLSARPARSPVNSDTDGATPDERLSRRYRSKDDFEHARDAAYDRFDAEWDARKDALKRAKDYYDYQADHSDGDAKDRWQRKKDEADHQLDQLDDQKDAAKKALKHQWNDD